MTSRRSLTFVLFCVVIGGWLRVWDIGEKSLWFDETFSRNVAVDSTISSLLTDGVAGDVHPPLYFVLLNAWVKLAGDSELALRWLGAMIAILTLPAFYHLARLLFDERTGRIALLLGALAPFQVYYAQEARQYTLSIFFAAWLGVGLIALLKGKRYGWPLYVLAAAGGLYTHYFIALLMVTLHLWLILHAPARRQWRRWLSADLAILLLFVPQALVFVRQTQAVLGDFWIEQPRVAAILTTPTYLMFSSVLGSIALIAAEVLIILLLLIGGLDLVRYAPRKVRPAWMVCLMAVFVTLGAAQIYSLARSSIYLDRSFGVLSPYLLAALAVSIRYTRRPSPVPLLAAALIGLCVYGNVSHALSAEDSKPPFRQIAADLMALPNATAAPVLHLFDSTVLPLRYYAPALDQRVGNLQERSWLFPKTWDIFHVKRENPDELDQWLADYQGPLRVVVSINMEQPGLDLLHSLTERACSVGVKKYPEASPQVFVYNLTLGACLALQVP